MEKNNQELLNVKKVDLIKYCKLRVNSRDLKAGDVFVVHNPILYTLDNLPIHVNGDVEVAYIAGENYNAMTKKYIEYLIDITNSK